MTLDTRRTISMTVVIAAAISLASFAGVSGAAGSTHQAPSARVGVLGGTWGTAEEVPGTAALNQSTIALLDGLSCASKGNCSASGSYTDSSGHLQVFVDSETNGSWGTAEEVPGIAALNEGGQAGSAVSCASAGNCSVGGAYEDASKKMQPYVADERNGTWRMAKEVPGTAIFNQSGNAAVNSLSCGSAGNCSAGGYYTDASGHQQAFVAGETNGIWGTAEELPGTPGLNQGVRAWVRSVSCRSVGYCSVGGIYTDSSGHTEAFVDTETGGRWAAAEEVPGIAALNQGEDADVDSVSYSSVGHCSADGFYADSKRHLQAFVVNQP
jgi:hypothetical protein